MIRSWVCLSLCHLYGRITKQISYLKQRDSIHYEPIRKAMTKVMNVEVIDPSTPTGCLKRFLNIFNPIAYFLPRSSSNVKKYLRGFQAYFVSKMPPPNQGWSRRFTDWNHLPLTTLRLF